jgi:DNA replicative helicase MCM subunit Mcm2 (Cdc46/Mcm family)
VTPLLVLDIEKMVSIKGMVIRCSSVIPELKEAVFRCLVCGFYSEPVMVDRGMMLMSTCSLMQF